MTASYRAVTALLLVSWLFGYIIFAWYMGSYIPENSKFLELLYFPIAGLAWIPIATWILKKRHRDDA